MTRRPYVRSAEWTRRDELLDSIVLYLTPIGHGTHIQVDSPAPSIFSFSEPYHHVAVLRIR